MKALAALFGAAIGFGAVVPRVSLDQLVATSEQIVHGRVTRSWVSWDRSRQFIWTHYQIAIAESVKGAQGSTVVVSEPGGTLDGYTLVIPGVVQYRVGEEAVVFLHRTPIGYLRTNGYHQGKYPVRTVAETGALKSAIRSRIR